MVWLWRLCMMASEPQRPADTRVGMAGGEQGCFPPTSSEEHQTDSQGLSMPFAQGAADQD